MFRHFNLLPVLTAQENITMPLLLDGRQPDEAYLQEIAVFLGIDKRLTHLPHELSGGQQRVAIARALITKPDIIFATSQLVRAVRRWRRASPKSKCSAGC